MKTGASNVRAYWLKSLFDADDELWKDLAALLYKEPPDPTKPRKYAAATVNQRSAYRTRPPERASKAEKQGARPEAEPCRRKRPPKRACSISPALVSAKDRDDHTRLVQSRSSMTDLWGQRSGRNSKAADRVGSTAARNKPAHRRSRWCLL